MIRGVHTMFYSSQPEELGKLIREKLGFSATDVGGGWLIFDLPEAEMGCHPAADADGKRSGTHDISFYCDDIVKTVAELRTRGVEFTDTITDAAYGLVTHFKMPGDFQVRAACPPRYAIKRSGEYARLLARKKGWRTRSRLESTPRPAHSVIQFPPMRWNERNFLED